MVVKKAKKSGKKQWMLDLGMVHGKRVRKFFESKQEADEEMAAEREDRRQHGLDAHTLPVSERLEFTAAKERLAAIGWTIMQAVMLAESQSKKLIAKPMSDAIEEFDRIKKATGKRHVYIRLLKARVKHFHRASPVHLVSEVTREQVEKWVHEAGKAAGTSRGRLIDLQTFFNFCAKRGWCAESPTKNIEKIMLEDKPPGIHTVKQVKDLLECALKTDPSTIGYLALIYFGGLRPAEAETITKEQIHGDVIEVTGAKAKTRRRRFIPINDTLRAWLDAPGVKLRTSKRRLNNLRTRLKPFPWPHDCLRHSFCSYGLPKFGAKDTAAYAGHSEQILFAHYRERVKPADAEKYWALRPKSTSPDPC